MTDNPITAAVKIVFGSPYLYQIVGLAAIVIATCFIYWPAGVILAGVFLVLIGTAWELQRKTNPPVEVEADAG